MKLKEKTSTIKHKFTGEQITFLKTEEETAGKYELVQITLPPKGEGPPLHYHENFEESFEILNGKLNIVVGSKQFSLNPGDTLTVPKKAIHRFKNESDENSVTFQVKITPAYNFEKAMRIQYGLMEDGLTDEQGVPNDRYHIALVLDMQDTKVVELPYVLKLLMKYLAKKARKKGIEEALFKKYVTK